MTGKDEITTRKALLIILVSLIDDIIILAVVILALWYLKVELSLWAMILIGLAIGAFIFVRTWVVLPNLRRKQETGAEGMIGMVGEVVESLTPEGVVRVEGEYWQAKSLDGNVEEGEGVEILEINRLKLKVRRKAS